MCERRDLLVQAFRRNGDAEIKTGIWIGAHSTSLLTHQNPQILPIHPLASRSYLCAACKPRHTRVSDFSGNCCNEGGTGGGASLSHIGDFGCVSGLVARNPFLRIQFLNRAKSFTLTHDHLVSAFAAANFSDGGELKKIFGPVAPAQKLNAFSPIKTGSKMSGVSVSVQSFAGSNLSVSAIKIRDNGSKSAYINYGGNKLRLQVGPLSCPYGMKDSSMFDKTGPVKYSVDLSLRGYDDAESPKVMSIYKALNTLDEWMIDYAVKNSRAWFKQDFTRDVVRAFYTPCVKFSKDKDGNLKPYPPTLKVALRQTGDKFDASIYDINKKPMRDIPMQDILVKGALTTMLIECTGVWFAGSKFGLSWKAVQIRVDRVPESIRDYAFEEDGESAPAAAAPAPRSLGRTATAAPPVNQFAGIDEDDDDMVDDEAALAPAPAPAAAVADESEDEAFEEVAPAPVPAKKVVMTKKRVVAAVKK